MTDVMIGASKDSLVAYDKLWQKLKELTKTAVEVVPVWVLNTAI